MPCARSHLLIFEPDHRGHAQEWIEHILEGVAASDDPPAISLLVPDELAHIFASRPGLDVYVPTNRLLSLCLSRWIMISGLARWWTMRRYLSRCAATHCLFLAFDHLSLPFGLGLRMAGRPVSGILFRPSVHYHEINSTLPTWRERLRDGCKEIFYRWMLCNPALETVLSLDPYFPRYAIDHYRHGSKVRALPDPAQRLIEPTRAETDLAAIAIPEDRVGFFLFGELSARKGVITLLDALPRLPAESAGKAAIVIAGRLDPALRDIVHRTVRDIRETHPELRLWLVDRFLSRGEIVATARRCSVILAPYQRFIGSSGVLIWAAALQRPVISQNYGLLGRLIRENGLGLTVDTSDPDALADAIAATIRDGADTLGRTDGMAMFAAARNREVFASSILRCSATAPKSASRNGQNSIWNVDTDWSQDSTAYSQPKPEIT